MNDNPLTEQELRTLLERTAPGAGAPDPLLLAAWIDGRLDEAAGGPVEAWLAANAPARAALAALRDAWAEPVAEPELDRLRALVPPATAMAPGRLGWRERFAAALGAWLPAPRVAVPALALVALCAWLGLVAGERLADAHWQRQAAAAAQGFVLLDTGV